MATLTATKETTSNFDASALDFDCNQRDADDFDEFGVTAHHVELFADKHNVTAQTMFRALSVSKRGYGNLFDQFADFCLEVA
jgi:hypothetical protein